MAMLERIDSPEDIKNFSYDELKGLAAEIREKIIRTAANNGGHLSSNLGVVELTLALHRVFNAPYDRFIFDVGHQCYTHKLLTGRRERFSTLRTYGGLSGFEKMSESEYDAFGTGHSSTSLSAAVGIATALKLDGNDAYTVAIAGDGAFTGGMVYEALNNCTKSGLKLIIVLNDNEMAISPNVGGLSRYFARVRVSSRYFKLKSNTKRFFAAVPLVGKYLVSAGRKCKNAFKRLVANENLFEQLGIEYLGPVNGDDLVSLERVLREAKQRTLPCVVHVRTKKGCGYSFAEDKPDIYHSVGRFDVETGIVANGESEKYSAEFGRIITKKAQEDDGIIAITAAMCSGTGLTEFSEKFPARFFDVGIAEEHAMTFAAGLASVGKKPVFAVYSSFLQRCYDQIIHDTALQGLHVVLAVDRAGLVPDDGPTHHGVFDVSFLSSVPGVTVYSPETFEDMRLAFEAAFEDKGIAAVRYPRGKCIGSDEGFVRTGTLSVHDEGGSTAVIITYGKITHYALEAAKLLKASGIGTRVIKLLCVYPPDMRAIKAFTAGAGAVLVLEEGIKQGGIGEKIACELPGAAVRAIDGSFVPQGEYELLLRTLHFMPDQIAGELIEMLGTAPANETK